MYPFTAIPRHEKEKDWYLPTTQPSREKLPMQQFVLMYLTHVVKNCAQRILHLEGTVRLEVFAYSLRTTATALQREQGG